jgi:hypothetical protein
MPRNRYTKLIRRAQRKQIAQQEHELVAIAQRLCFPDESTADIPHSPTAKERRIARLEQKRRRRSERQTSSADSVQSQ